jgi:hypothetical protein
MRLLVLVPCERVIIGQDDNNPTLIALLQEIGVEYQLVEKPETGTLAALPSIVVPLRWNIFTLWRADEGDSGKTFVQVIRVTNSAGMRLIDQAGEFTMEKLNQRITAQVPGIPIRGGSGTWNIEVFVHEKNQPLPSLPSGSFPIDIHIVEQVELKNP